MEKINKSPAVFDYQKLEWFNGSYIRKLSAAEFGAAVKPLLMDAGYLTGTTAEDALLSALGPLVQERVKLLTDVPAMVRFIFEEPAPPAPQDLVAKKTDPVRVLDALKRLEPILPELSAGGDQHETRLRAIADELGMKLGDMLMPLRVAVTGARVSPPLFDSIRLMGPEKARARTARAIAILTDYTDKELKDGSE
jgi:glutamyl-tRNA synthetase